MVKFDVYEQLTLNFYTDYVRAGPLLYNNTGNQGLFYTAFQNTAIALLKIAILQPVEIPIIKFILIRINTYEVIYKEHGLQSLCNGR